MEACVQRNEEDERQELMTDISEREREKSVNQVLLPGDEGDGTLVGHPRRRQLAPGACDRFLFFRSKQLLQW